MAVDFAGNIFNHRGASSGVPFHLYSGGRFKTQPVNNQSTQQIGAPEVIQTD